MPKPQLYSNSVTNFYRGGGVLAKYPLVELVTYATPLKMIPKTSYYRHEYYWLFAESLFGADGWETPMGRTKWSLNEVCTLAWRAW